MNSPLVHISILNWNGSSDTIPCVDSVLRSDYRNFKVVVVDNGSTDDSVTVLRERFPHVTLIENGHNAGFTGGNNLAIEQAVREGADYVWLLNNDTEIEPTTISGIVALAEAHPDLGFVTPLVCYHENKSLTQFGGATIDPVTMAVKFFSDEERGNAEFLIAPNIFLWGTALLVKTSLIKRIGMLDASLFMYWEDTEFSLRAGKSGFSGGICCTERIYHKTPINDFGKRGRHYYYYMVRNAILVARKCLGDSASRAFVRKKTTDTFLTIADLFKLGETASAHAALMGVIHGLAGKVGKMNLHSANLLTGMILCLVAKYPYISANVLNGEYRHIVQRFGRKIRGGSHV